jgi:hypothetical protein
MKPIYVYLFVLTTLLLAGCENAKQADTSTDAKAALEATRDKLHNLATHSYRYVSFWDNRFASSTYSDSARVRYSYLPDSQFGFGFHTIDESFETLYDGQDKLAIDHEKRKVVRLTAGEIGQDSAYFDNLMAFHNAPKALPALSAFRYVADTMIAGDRLFVYAITSFNPTDYDSSKLVNTTREYFIHPERQEVTRIRKSTHIDYDTVQIIDYSFSAYTFSDEPHVFGPNDRQRSLGYRELSEAADDEERLSGLVKSGDQLNRSDYPDINGTTQDLYGKPGQETIVMFSFIGCGGCEYAMREMKKKEFALRDGVRLVYSSPVDQPEALEKYFNKKEFPFEGFGKDSRMNDNFKVAAFPTFVQINAEGRVEQVIGGYDQEVEDIIFE